MEHVSICIPAYIATPRRGKTLHESIASALAQDYDDFEVIVVDDNSPLDIYDYISDFHDSRLKIIKEKQRAGLTKNVIRSINYGTNIIKPLCDDDCIAPDYLKQTIPLVCQYGYLVTALAESPKTFGKKEGADEMYAKGSLVLRGGRCAFPAQIFTRKVWDELGGYDPAMYYFDYDFSVRAFFLTGGCYLATALCWFRTWNESSSSANPNIYIHYEEAAATLAKMIPLLTNCRQATTVRQECHRAILRAMLAMLRHPRRFFSTEIRKSFLNCHKGFQKNLLLLNQLEIR